jgi:hypothetical protein
MAKQQAFTLARLKTIAKTSALISMGSAVGFIAVITLTKAAALLRR